MAKKKADKKEATCSVDTSKALDTAITALKKKFGEKTICWLSENPDNDLDVIPTGSLALDAALGVGGIARGRLYELYGPTASGKSTVAYAIIAEAQKMGLKSAYIDAECTLDKRLVEKMGAHASDIILVRGFTGEDNLDMAETLMATGEIAICVIDSVSALQPQAEANLQSFSDNTMGLHPRLMSRMCRTFTSLAMRTNTTLLLINQVRANLGMGAPETTSGGNAIQHHITGKIRVYGGGIKSRQIHGPDGEVVGHRVLFEVKKNKLAIPYRTGEADLIYGVGFDTTKELLDFGVDMGFVEQSGSWFNMDGERLGQGATKASKFLDDNQDKRDLLRKNVMSVFGFYKEGDSE